VAPLGPAKPGAPAGPAGPGTTTTGGGVTGAGLLQAAKASTISVEANIVEYFMGFLLFGINENRALQAHLHAH
jgi:hypothetical protein